MARLTAVEKTRRRRARLHTLANQSGYATWYRLTTALLNGDLLIVNPNGNTDKKDK